MSWNKSVFTTVGTDMMSEVLSGATMTITKAVGGSGTTEEASLAALTDVQEEKQTLKILGIEDASDSTGNDAGKRIKIQITNGDVEAGYILHQVGVYAKLTDGDETLLFIMQDDRGVEIPSHTENSDFVIELFGVMAISNIANIKVTVETVVLLSKGEVDSKKIRVEFSLEDMDMSEFQDGATYTQIKDYVLEHSGLKVSNLYISQIKRKCGIEVGKNYNLPKSEDSRQPMCPPEKEKAIREAFKYFGMI